MRNTTKSELKYTKLKILNEKEKRVIEKKLGERFCIDKINGLLITKGKEKIFFFSGNLKSKDIKKIEEISVVERVGIYFAKIIDRNNKDIKLSIEGVQILKDQIKKNILEIPDEFVEKWMKGEDLHIKSGKRGFVVIKNKEDFLGCGKASEEKVGNFIPKNRRLKEKII